MRPTVVSGPWPRLQRAWDIRAACNFIGGGTGTGLILLALAAALGGADWLPALLLGLLFVGFGLTMVLFEIGRPWRALNVFLHPQTSWMTREGVLALPLFGAGVAAAAAEWLGWHGAALAGCRSRRYRRPVSFTARRASCAPRAAFPRGASRRSHPTSWSPA